MEIETQEHPAARRMREQFESKYGDLSDVMRAINHWRNQVEEFRRPYNRDMESPVTNADLDVAEEAMLAEIRRYAGKLPPQNPEEQDALKSGKPEVRFLPPNTSD